MVFIFDETTTQTPRYESLGLVGARNAVNTPPMPANPHLGDTAQNNPNPVPIPIQYHRLPLVNFNLTHILACEWVRVLRRSDILKGTPPNKVLRKTRAIAITGEGKGPRIIDKGPGADVLMGKRERSSSPQRIPGKTRTYNLGVDEQSKWKLAKPLI